METIMFYTSLLNKCPPGPPTLGGEATLADSKSKMVLVTLTFFLEQLLCMSHFLQWSFKVEFWHPGKRFK
jgi:hypothetical protein